MSETLADMDAASEAIDQLTTKGLEWIRRAEAAEAQAEGDRATAQVLKRERDKAEAENDKLREEAVTLAGRVEELTSVVAGFTNAVGLVNADGERITYQLFGEQVDRAHAAVRDPTPHLQLVRAAMEFTEAVSAAEAGDGSNENALADAAHKALNAYRKAKEECGK